MVDGVDSSLRQAHDSGCGDSGAVVVGVWVHRWGRRAHVAFPDTVLESARGSRRIPAMDASPRFPFDSARADLAAWHERRDRQALERFFRVFLARVRGLVDRRFPRAEDRIRYTNDILSAVAERFLKDARLAVAESLAYWDRPIEWEISNVRRTVDGVRSRPRREEPAPVTASPTGGIPKAGTIEFDDAIHSAELAETHGHPVASADAQLIRRTEAERVRSALAGLAPMRRVAVILELTNPGEVLSFPDFAFLKAASGLDDDALRARLESFDPTNHDAVLAVRFHPTEYQDKAGRDRCLDTLRVARRHGIRALAERLRDADSPPEEDK
jgi:hypothetical protein